ncbi:MAG: DsrE/DsrF/DrsH-like family protein [Methanobacteriota archaeon]
MSKNALLQEPRKEYEQTMKRAVTKKVGSMTIIVTEDVYDKALTAFNIGVAGAELGMTVTMFFTSRGVNILRKSYKPRRARWGEAPIAWKESSMKRRGGPVLAELMYQAKDMGVRFYACYTSMISMGLDEQMFISGVKVMRMVEFLELAIEADTHFVLG